jgi:hypothetical protein
MKIDGKNKYKIAPDNVGKQFGSWTVLEQSKSRKGRSYWKCKCECGRIKEVSGQTLKEKKSTKCTRCNIKFKNRTHGYCSNGKKIPEYHIWNSIKNRCNNPNTTGYHNYGGRGIKLSKEWQSDFLNFLNDMGKKPYKNASVERIDNDGNYCKENCKWIPMQKQGGNTRKSPMINGQRLCITQFSRTINKNRFWVSSMLKKGLSPETIAKMDGPIYTEYYLTPSTPEK